MPDPQRLDVSFPSSKIGLGHRKRSFEQVLWKREISCSGHEDNLAPEHNCLPPCRICLLCMMSGQRQSWLRSTNLVACENNEPNKLPRSTRSQGRRAERPLFWSHGAILPTSLPCSSSCLLLVLLPSSSSYASIAMPLRPCTRAPPPPLSPDLYL